MADDTAGLLDALKIPKAHVFGVSMGGAIAQQFALKYPDKLDKLILGCTMAGGNCSQIGDIGGVMNGNLLNLLFTTTFIQANSQELAEFLAKATPFHSKSDALQRQLQALATHDTCDRLTDIQATTLIITGDKDVTIPRSNINVLAAKIPNVKLELIADAAHGFSFSHPDITADLIHLFLQQPSSPEKTIMKDQSPAILKKFSEYAQIFNLLEPTKVAPFFHLPAMLMTSEQVAAMKSSEEVIAVLTVMMDKLRAENFKESKIVDSLQVTQLSDNQGQVMGLAKRFNKLDEEIEHFGFTYILRKVQVKDEWKIIAGIIHEPETLSK